MGKSDGPLETGHPGTHIGLVPAPYLDWVAKVAQHFHHPVGDRLVGGRVGREEDGCRAPARGEAQGHARVHAELTRFVGRAGDDLAGFGRVPATADDHRQSDKFGVALQLHRREELVEVDVQNPAFLGWPAGFVHVPQSLRANISQLSPSSRRVRPRSAISWCT